MPKIDANYGQLLALRDDIIQQQNKSAAFFFFNKSRVEKFRQLNHMQLAILKSRMEGFVTKYVKLDANQQPITEEKDGIQMYTFYSKEYEEKYTTAINHFMKLPIKIEL